MTRPFHNPSRGQTETVPTPDGAAEDSNKATSYMNDSSMRRLQLLHRDPRPWPLRDEVESFRHTTLSSGFYSNRWKYSQLPKEEESGGGEWKILSTTSITPNQACKNKTQPRDTAATLKMRCPPLLQLNTQRLGKDSK